MSPPRKSRTKRVDDNNTQPVSSLIGFWETDTNDDPKPQSVSLTGTVFFLVEEVFFSIPISILVIFCFVFTPVFQLLNFLNLDDASHSLSFVQE